VYVDSLRLTGVLPPPDAPQEIVDRSAPARFGSEGEEQIKLTWREGDHAARQAHLAGIGICHQFSAPE